MGVWSVQEVLHSGDLRQLVKVKRPIQRTGLCHNNLELEEVYSSSSFLPFSITAGSDSPSTTSVGAAASSAT